MYDEQHEIMMSNIDNWEFDETNFMYKWRENSYLWYEVYITKATDKEDRHRFLDRAITFAVGWKHIDGIENRIFSRDLINIGNVFSGIDAAMQDRSQYETL